MIFAAAPKNNPLPPPVSKIRFGLFFGAVNLYIYFKSKELISKMHECVAALIDGAFLREEPPRHGWSSAARYVTPPTTALL